MKLLTITLLIITSINAYALECGNRGPSKNGLNFRNIPVYDQNGFGGCYSYTATQMIDYWKQTHGQPSSENTSPIFAAFISKQKNWENANELSGGITSITIETLKEYGSCRKNIVDNAIKRFSNKNSVNPATFLSFIEKIFKDYRTRSALSEELSDSKMMSRKKIENDYSRSFHKAQCAYESKGLLDNVNIQKLYSKIEDYAVKADFIGLMEDIFGECKKGNMKKIDVPDVINMKIESNELEKSVEKIDKLLSKNNPQPIGINYCSQVLLDKNYQKSNDNLECEHHASTIVGRRMKNGKCQILIRNSWGSSCNYDWECKTSSENLAEGIWINADTLLKNTTSIDYFDN